MVNHKRNNIVHSTNLMTPLLLLSACIGGGGGGNKASVSGTPASTSRTITFDGVAIIGSYSDDLSLRGTDEADIILDNSGTNIIHAEGGNDWVFATGQISGGEGNDAIFSEGQNDEVQGNEGHDIIVAQNNSQNIRLYGGGGNDYIQVSYDGEVVDYEQTSSERRAPINETFDLDELITTVEFSTPSNGKVYVDGGSGNDFLYVNSTPDSSEKNTVIGGSGNDHIIVTFDSRIITGQGDDNIFLFFGELTGGNYSNDLTLEIADFTKGSDKLVLIFHEDSHPEFETNEAALRNLFLSGNMIDYHNDGTTNDLRLEIALDNQINDMRQNMTVILENVGEQLTISDLEIMTDTEFDTYQNNQMDTYLNALL